MSPHPSMPSPLRGVPWCVSLSHCPLVFPSKLLHPQGSGEAPVWTLGAVVGTGMVAAVLVGAAAAHPGHVSCGKSELVPHWDQAQTPLNVSLSRCDPLNRHVPVVPWGMCRSRCIPAHPCIPTQGRIRSRPGRAGRGPATHRVTPPKLAWGHPTAGPSWLCHLSPATDATIPGPQ